ncbi:MAG: Gfo/Idh/MocA family oxidoreductase [Clostridia bacterium]|nr:Gfo/Idh/MocA family oxidoreductase [Clostridia bacterium]
MNKKPLTAIIVGAGHRAMIYADYSLEHPDELKIVGIAEPDEFRVNEAVEKYGIPAENCFKNSDELAMHDKFADIIINGTMDQDHVKTSIPLLKKGYDMLLEKPFAVNKEEMKELVDVVNENNNKVMICHVLRYSEFYRSIKEIIAAGEIGEIISIQLCEDVSYHHYATSYVRGKWSNSNYSGTSMLLAKCCHDIDLMMWMMGDVKPEFVTSTGSLQYFRNENAPENAGTRCMVDCPHVDTCNLSARRIYLDLPGKWDFYVWPELHHAPYDEKYEYLKNISPFGKCAYKCNNNVVDHQTVMVKFSNGATGSHNLTGGCAYSQRIIRVIGTKGEINGVFEDQKFTVSYINPHSDSDHIDKVFDLSERCSAFVGHGGGDHALVADFVKFVNDDNPSVSCTAIADSVAGHLVIFCADESMNNGAMPVKTEF